MDKLKVALMPVAFLLVAVPAHAYVGPGAGLSLLGALWALIAAIGTALIFVIVWPIRRMRRRKREAAEQAREQAAERDAREQQPSVSRLKSSGDDEKDLDRLQPQ